MPPSPRGLLRRMMHKCWSAMPPSLRGPLRRMKNSCTPSPRRVGERTAILQPQAANPAFCWLTGQMTKDLACPACGDAGDKEKMVNASDPYKAPDEDSVVLHRCLACDSRFLHPFRTYGYGEEFAYSQKILPHYCEVGAGIDFIIRPLQKIRSRLRADGGNRKLLDVGCGYGFASLYARDMLGMETKGYEPSGYGILGKRDLGLDIVEGYFTGAAEAESGGYKVVYCSEVVEHVPHPRDFLRELASAVSDDGFLVLTTPCADFLRPDNRDLSLLLLTECTLIYEKSTLHYCLLSEKAVRDTLAELGFSYIAVQTRPAHRMVVVAGKKPFALEEDEKGLHADYLAFLESMSQYHKEESPLRNGVLFRMFKELVNDGECAEAEKWLKRYRRNFERRFPVSYDAPLEALPRLVESLARAPETIFEEIGKTWPHNLPCLLYYQGMLELNHRADYAAAAASFNAAFSIASAFASTMQVFYLEWWDLLWKMKFHEGLALQYGGDAESAKECYACILSHSGDTPEYRGQRPDGELLLSAAAKMETLEPGWMGKLFRAFRSPKPMEDVHDLPGQKDASAPPEEPAAAVRAPVKEMSGWENGKKAAILSADDVWNPMFTMVIPHGCGIAPIYYFFYCLRLSPKLLSQCIAQYPNMTVQDNSFLISDFAYSRPEYEGVLTRIKPDVDRPTFWFVRDPVRNLLHHIHYNSFHLFNTYPYLGSGMRDGVITENAYRQTCDSFLPILLNPAEAHWNYWRYAALLQCAPSSRNITVLEPDDLLPDCVEETVGGILKMVGMTVPDEAKSKLKMICGNFEARLICNLGSQHWFYINRGHLVYQVYAIPSEYYHLHVYAHQDYSASNRHFTRSRNFVQRKIIGEIECSRRKFTLYTIYGGQYGEYGVDDLGDLSWVLEDSRAKFHVQCYEAHLKEVVETYQKLKITADVIMEHFRNNPEARKTFIKMMEPEVEPVRQRAPEKVAKWRYYNQLLEMR